MASTWPSARSKTFANGGTGTPGDFNAVQDQYVRPNGISMTDLGGGAGKAIIPGTETLVAPAAYSLAPTPDQVAGIVLLTDGLLKILFQATWQESVIGAAKAAIFIGGNQLQSADSVSASPLVQETVHNAPAANTDKPLTTYWVGIGGGATTAVAHAGDVTTGQVVGRTGPVPSGGPCYIFAAAGTYTISVKYKASSGNVTVKNRKLWVSSEAYS